MPVEAVAIGGGGTINDIKEGRDDGGELGSNSFDGCCWSCDEELEFSSSSWISPPPPGDDDDEGLGSPDSKLNIPLKESNGCRDQVEGETK